jgi:hypothetical protein
VPPSSILRSFASTPSCGTHRRLSHISSITWRPVILGHLTLFKFLQICASRVGTSNVFQSRSSPWWRLPSRSQLRTGRRYRNVASTLAACARKTQQPMARDLQHPSMRQWNYPLHTPCCAFTDSIDHCLYWPRDLGLHLPQAPVNPIPPLHWRGAYSALPLHGSIRTRIWPDTRTKRLSQQVPAATSAGRRDGSIYGQQLANQTTAVSSLRRIIDHAQNPEYAQPP